ncbi:hypothetical protein BCR33DRAFT_336597 [Rhizoclosmatium globosum]|uniref:MYND-type domain-containing protein n=1 Tax=Rhizoclosmatium globosum TaxID=329046 RepID=A0A1Y2C5N0_9FUNG|nr:hypothetical protein BCR33DRAFT_336597 [Rhizoclosmatium globosum]|eukprot:ORY41615.1 hypothetical protein BCR33DRAFT_336597 [Rhizoclosmatium globosum]
MRGFTDPPPAVHNLYMKAEELAQEGRYRESLDQYIKCYPLVPRTAYTYWYCLSAISSIIRHNQCDIFAEDDAFLKKLQNDSNAPTHHRAQAAFTRARLAYNQGNREASAQLYRKVVSLSETITPTEYSTLIVTGVNIKTFQPEIMTVKEWIDSPQTFLTLAKENLAFFNSPKEFKSGLTEIKDIVVDKMLEQQRLRTPEAAFGHGNFFSSNSSKTATLLMCGPFMSKERYDAEYPIVKSVVLDRTPGFKCDVCGILAVDESGEKEVLNSLKKCNSCYSKFYCSVECQRKAWKAGHKKMCRAPTDLVKFDLVRIHGLKNEMYSQMMNGSVFEVRGPLLPRPTDGSPVKWRISIMGGNKQLVIKEMNITRVMFREERFKWEELEGECMESNPDRVFE